MKKLICLLFLLQSLGCFGQDLPAYVIYTKAGKKTSFSKLKKDVLQKKFIFFGELHDNPIAHWMQYTLLEALYQQHGANLLAGSEMFEQDNQQAVNAYLLGKIPDDKFNDSCRLWPNYETDYKPMLDFAREFKIPWIATNIPRKYASQVYKKGVASLDSLNTLEKSYLCPLPYPVDTTLSQYSALMNGEMHMGNNFVYSQAIKDATMAYWISKSLTQNSVFYHLNGSYHSDYFQGILWYLNYYTKANYSNMITISTVTQENIQSLDAEFVGKADYIICVPEHMTRTH